MKPPNPLPTRAELRRLLDYDPSTGDLTWKRRTGTPKQVNSFNANFADKPAFTAIGSTGHRQGKIYNRTYLAHRVIWKWMTGKEPPEIDHRDGCRANNRFANLRAANRTINTRNRARQSNNTSGHVGVSVSKNRNGQRYWRAMLQRKHIGNFPYTDQGKLAAIAARQAAAAAIGFDPTHGLTAAERAGTATQAPNEGLTERDIALASR